MKLEDQVVSLELAKKLKELGYKQESLFYWRLGYHTSEKFDNGKSLGKEGVFDDKYRVEFYPKPRMTTADFKWNESDLQKLTATEISAYTVAELVNLLTTVAKQDIIIAYNDNSPADTLAEKLIEYAQKSKV